MNEFKQGLKKHMDGETLKKIERTVIGIAGAGGLGSNCAQALVRSGFGKLVVADFDRIESSNLNRQFYFTDQIGMMKIEALRNNLLRINPDLELKAHSLRLDKENIKELFADCSVVVEAFDSPDCKKMLVESFSGSGKKIISASGLGCEGSTDGIVTRRISDEFMLIGDMKNCTETGAAPMSPGVAVAAAKQAGAVLEYVLSEEKRRSFRLPDLYGLTYSECSAGRSNIEIVREMIKAGITLIQYREKEKSMKEKYAECLQIREMTRKAGVFFIVNDHLDIAMMVGADGIHLGQDDIPLRQVRGLVGQDMIIGISTHSPWQAEQAVRDGADYIGVGPVYATKTKKDVCAPVGHEYLEWAVANIDIPFVAIGGIKEHNLHQITGRGAICAALVSEITGNGNIPALVKRLRKIIKESKV